MLARARKAELGEQAYKEMLKQAEADLNQLRAELEATKKDAECWRRVQRNPFIAIDKILAAVDVNQPAYWHTQADAAMGHEDKE